jgi:ComF family protein
MSVVILSLAKNPLPHMFNRFLTGYKVKSMQNTLAKGMGFVFDLLFPIECLGCGKNFENLPARERWICPDCRERIDLRAEQVCPVCEQESEGGKTHGVCRDQTFLDGLWAACYYDPLIERAVHQLKFEFSADISYPLGQLLCRSLLETPDYGEVQDMLCWRTGKEEEEGAYVGKEAAGRREAFLVPVPLHRRRYNWRGFNQARLLSRPLEERFGLKAREDLLLRRRHTKPQSTTLSGAERRKNIHGAFLCPRPKGIVGKDFILVDDVCTTSATLDECARELKRCGARRVWGLVVARR